MHHLTFVLLDAKTDPSDIPQATAAAMALFDENLDVPHIVATAEEVVANRDQVVAQYPGYAEKYADLDTFVRDWHGHKGLDEHGNALSTRNPNGKWDWYTIGGRWGGLLVVGWQDVNSARLKDINPARLYATGILLADGKWLDTEASVPYPKGLAKLRETDPDKYESRLAEWENKKRAIWQAKFGHILESAKQQVPQQWLTVVDRHH